MKYSIGNIFTLYSVSIVNVIYYKIAEIKSLKKLLMNLRRRLKIQSIFTPQNYLKQYILKKYARRFSINTLVETGTCEGDMIFAVRNSFKKIYSIELDNFLYEYSKRRLSNYKHINLFLGDSIFVLPKIILKIKQPCLFWLDAHYSGGITTKSMLETPIVNELNIILNTNLNHVILIDDAKLFKGKNDYPTLEELNKIISNKKSDWTLKVKYDIIRIHKKII